VRVLCCAFNVLGSGLAVVVLTLSVKCHGQTARSNRERNWFYTVSRLPERAVIGNATDAPNHNLQRGSVKLLERRIIPIRSVSFDPPVWQKVTSRPLPWFSGRLSATWLAPRKPSGFSVSVELRASFLYSILVFRPLVNRGRRPDTVSMTSGFRFVPTDDRGPR